MKLYHSLTEALKAIYVRPPKQVIGIVSFNGQAYFVQRSSLHGEGATRLNVGKKFAIGNELHQLINNNDKQRLNGKEASDKLFNYMSQNGIPTLFNAQSMHAEENIILHFNKMVQAFKTVYPDTTIKSIDIFLTHSPCVSPEKSCERGHSSAKEIAGIEMPEGCDSKLAIFFKSKFKENNIECFSTTPKVKIRYAMPYTNEVDYAHPKVEEADKLLAEKLKSTDFKRR